MKDSVQDLLPLTEAYFYILVTLYRGDAHGYAMMQDVEQMSRGRVRIGAGTLYTALSTLQKKGLIDFAQGADSTDSRRKLYAITDKGREVLKGEMVRLEELLHNARQAIEQTLGGGA
ncbi:PadR family transcriptional regulator [Paenibacillus cellulosilyticus]|uniref:PadR family transcriptional regulator n=1 Tax=Paenibacillus cellulosilyticus TaxID=375489 RepID=A0A2V2YUI8_9BACL|nr:PadR family transcriptional regulator [Paenibacillus cellulosilyticus]PWW00921.1 PadR family transcriptional regulator [Paenibacillus cellulosilyticus]QKS47576.1 PadR family transcriptional regulator [Paenibacillus cellulosilyticus]